MSTFIFTFILFMVAMLGMATGLLLRKNHARGELKGSCGGPDNNPECCLRKQKACASLLKKNNLDENSSC